MLTKVYQKLTTTIGGGAVIIATFSIISRLLGLVRDRLLAAQFGAGDTLDAYFAAFKLPDLIFNTLVLGALSAAFIPVFVGLWQKETDHKKAWQVTNSIINILVILLSFFGLIFFIFAPQLLPLIAPGFDGEKLALTIKLTRVMMVSIVFFGVSNVLSGVLNSLKRFISYSLAPVMYNVGIIFGILVLVRFWGSVGLAIGVALGSFLHLVIQLPAVIRVGFSWQLILEWRDGNVREIAKLMLPRTFALGINQINQLVITIIASTLAAGSLAIFNLAFNLQSFPIGVFAISIAIATFPAFSENYVRQDRELFMINFSVAVRRVLYLIVPLSAFVILLRAQIVRVILGSGKFDWTDTVLTANALGFFCLSLFAQGLLPIFTRTFYAQHNTRTPLLVSFVALTINIIAAVVLARHWGVEGLVLAFSIASICNTLLLYLILRYRLGYLDDKQIIKSLAKIVFATLIASAFLQISKPFFASLVNMQTFVGVFTQGICAGSLGILIYLILTFIFKSPEIEIVKRYFRRIKM